MANFTIDTKAAIQDFDKYNRGTQAKLLGTLATYAQVTSGEQKNILVRKVKKWTGRLASSIYPTKKRDTEYEIGPDKVVYAWYIEAGSAPGQNSSFKGYHYVRDSLKAIEKRFILALKKDVEGF